MYQIFSAIFFDSQSSETAAKALKPYNRGIVGRPTLETDQPGLVNSILDLVLTSTAADPKRRSEMLSTTRTLDDLHSHLIRMDYKLSRSSTHYRLLPPRANTREGKRHVNIAPVKLLRPERNLRKKNKDRIFAKSYCDDLKFLDQQFGHHAVNYVSMDDKAKVPIGLAAANCQAAILMHVDYKVIMFIKLRFLPSCFLKIKYSNIPIHHKTKYHKTRLEVLIFFSHFSVLKRWFYKIFRYQNSYKMTFLGLKLVFYRNPYKQFPFS